MKLRHPRLISMASWFGAAVIRRWMGTLKVAYVPLGTDCDPHRPLDRKYVYCFWHEGMLLPAWLYGRPDIHVLISKHADGQLITETIHRLGFRTVRGSTTRGGVEALKQMLTAMADSHLAVTPDGPRGPRRQAQVGAVYLASRLGRPLLPFGVGFSKCWRINSWDKFAIPKPWTQAVLVSTEAFSVPPNAERDDLERYRRQLEERLNEATRLAEEWAVHGVPEKSLRRSA